MGEIGDVVTQEGIALAILAVSHIGRHCCIVRGIYRKSAVLLEQGVITVLLQLCNERTVLFHRLQPLPKRDTRSIDRAGAAVGVVVVPLVTTRVQRRASGKEQHT